MQRLIDANKIEYDKTPMASIHYVLKDSIDSVPTVEAIPKADYENRLKADIVAMLTDIQLEIEELRLDRALMSRGYECYGHKDKTPTEIRQECSDIIQQKIDALKEQTDENDD